MVSLAWREKAKYYGPWVFFSEDERRVKHDHETVHGHQALALCVAEGGKGSGGTAPRAAGNARLPADGGGEIIKLTGDIVAAAHFIGDKDLRIVNKSYTKRRDDQLREVAEWRATGRIRTDDRSITNRELYP